MSTPGALRVLERNLHWFRRLWRANLLNSLLQPMLYLLGLGVGVGTLVNRNASSTAALGGLAYQRFVAPGLLCTTAMSIAFVESAWPVLGGFKWQPSYVAMATTPLRAVDIVLGHIAWVTLRLLAATCAVTSALMLFPSVRTVRLVPTIAFATISGLALGMAVTAYSSYQQRETGFVSIGRFVLIPLFLFGGAFFPVSQLPVGIRVVVKVFPLWHGTELSRSFVTHSLGFGELLAHLAYLLLWIVVGTVISTRQFARRLGV